MLSHTRGVSPTLLLSPRGREVAGLASQTGSGTQEIVCFSLSIKDTQLLENEFKERVIKKLHPGTSLVVWWLRIHLCMQGTWVQSLVGELRPHLPLSI